MGEFSGWFGGRAFILLDGGGGGGAIAPFSLPDCSHYTVGVKFLPVALFTRATLVNKERRHAYVSFRLVCLITET